MLSDSKYAPGNKLGRDVIWSLHLVVLHIEHCICIPCACQWQHFILSDTTLSSFIICTREQLLSSAKISYAGTRRSCCWTLPYHIAIISLSPTASPSAHG